MNEKQTITNNINTRYVPISNTDINFFTSTCMNEAGELDLRKFPDKQISEFYKNKSDKTSIIDLSGATSELIVMIINFILFCFFYMPVVSYTTWDQIHMIYMRTLRLNICNFKEAGTVKNYIDIASRDTDFLKYQAHRWFLTYLKNFIAWYDAPNDWFKRPIWFLRDPHFHIAEERINVSRTHRSLDFSSIENPENQRMVMEYIDHLIFKRTTSISTIVGTLNNLMTLCKFLGEDYIADVDAEKLDEFFLWYREGNYSGEKPSHNSLAKLYGILFAFYDFLSFKTYISKNPFIGYDYVPKQHWIPKENSVDDFVIDQIYAILPEIPVMHALIFLIDDCTGFRISDICRLKKNRLLSKVGDRCFLEYYNTKEKRGVPTEIPPELHYLLSVYIKTQHNNGSEYLFPNAYKGAYRAATFSDTFNQYLSQHNVRIPSGEPYRYVSHGLRHKQATDLEKRGATIYTIAKRLNDSLEVAAGYADYRDKEKAADMSDFAEVLTSEETSTYVIPIETESDQIAYLRQTMNGLALTHGSCKRPAVLGECVHDPSFCLSCDKFVTCHTFLNVHKKHLARLEEALKIAKSAGNDKSVKKIESSISAIKKTIRNLEEE